MSAPVTAKMNDADALALIRRFWKISADLGDAEAQVDALRKQVQALKDEATRGGVDLSVEGLIVLVRRVEGDGR